MKQAISKLFCMLTLANIAAALVAFVALASFALSYDSLRNTALAGQVAPQLSWLWPLTLDAVVLAAGLSILWANQNGTSKRFAWFVLVVAEVGSIYFNVVLFWEAGARLAVLVHITAPLGLLVCFELLSQMIRHGLQVAGAQESLAALLRQVAISQSELADVQASLAALEQQEAELTEKRKAQFSRYTVQQWAVAVAAMNNPNGSYDTIGKAANCSREYARQSLAVFTADGLMHKNGNGWEATQ